MAISQQYANSILNHIFCNNSIGSLPDKLYLGVCSAAPNAKTGVVSSTTDGVTTYFEPEADSYGRVCIGGGGTGINEAFGSASGGVITNSQDIQMPAAKEAWGKMNYWFVSTSSAKNGAAILWGELKDAETGAVGVTIDARTVPVFYAGDLKASIDVELE